MQVEVTRLVDGPIIGPELHPSIGVNIPGSSLIRVPEWVLAPLGRCCVPAKHPDAPAPCGGGPHEHRPA